MISPDNSVLTASLRSAVVKWLGAEERFTNRKLPNNTEGLRLKNKLQLLHLSHSFRQIPATWNGHSEPPQDKIEVWEFPQYFSSFCKVPPSRRKSPSISIRKVGSLLVTYMEVKLKHGSSLIKISCMLRNSKIFNTLKIFSAWIYSMQRQVARLFKISSHYSSMMCQMKWGKTDWCCYLVTRMQQPHHNRIRRWC